VWLHSGLRGSLAGHIRLREPVATDFLARVGAEHFGAADFADDARKSEIFTGQESWCGKSG